jgi:hypothetical protein
MLESHKNSRRVLRFLGLMAASLVGLLLLPPISQDQNYHDFADQRTIIGIRISGTSFQICHSLRSVAGIVTLIEIRRSSCFSRILMTGFGSSYYPDPNDHRCSGQAADVISFMAILALAIEERLDARQVPPAVAVDCDWRIQPLAVALDR